MNQNLIPEHRLEWITTGRPKNAWMQGINGILTAIGLKVRDREDRVEWGKKTL